MGTFGERLKKAREEKGFTQKSFAEALEITPTRLNYWEKDKREPDFFQIRKILNLLEISFEELCGITQSHNQELQPTEHEQKVVAAYRAQPAMQPAVDKLLGVEDSPPTPPANSAALADDMIETMRQFTGNNSTVPTKQK